jgi:bifunctional non-homologous end joining protein LigD
VGLQQYHEKRRFQDTPEPRGTEQGSTGPLRFVVQKHSARRLHYDLRLEMDGVLKSWAVPKGPSLDPSQKRLALMVEDHPREYRTFEGIIPDGNYGAGTVMVWDEGAFEPLEATGDRAADEKKLLDQLQAGSLKIVLHGKKLRGEFALVRMKRGKGNEWLLIKHRDKFAQTDDVLAHDRSALTERDMKAIAEGSVARGDVWQSNGRPAERARKKLKLRNIKPMLATAVTAPFDRAGWLFEIKWDGYRAIAEIDHGEVGLYSRNRISYEDRFAPIVNALARLPHEAVLDGEVVVLDEQGRAQFELLQKYQQSGRGALVYYVFDLLHLDGADLRREPLRRRKERLASLLRGSTLLRISDHIEEHGKAFFHAVTERGVEGMVAKKADSPYREGVRSTDWLKIKARQRHEAVIGGFTAPRGEREAFGALVLGVYDGADLVHIGQAGSGFDTKSLGVVNAKLQPLIQAQCPFKKRPKTDTRPTWVKPELVCEVLFQEWTSEGIMRFPIFFSLREDKPARSVTRERPKSVQEVVPESKTAAPEAKPSSGRRDAGRRAAKAVDAELPPGSFSNLDKVYFPEDSITKGDVLRYYHQVAPVMLPHLRDRIVSMNRHPDGIRGPNFFQKDVNNLKLPEFITTATIDSNAARKKLTCIVGQNEATLLYVANLGCIEINVWNSRTDQLEHPDYMIIDIDPQDVPFTQVVEAAQAVHKLLEKHCAECFCKTSGKRGLHVYLPLGARYHYDQVRGFAEIAARVIHERLPGTTSLARQPALRRNKIYLDYLQNRRGQTMAAPYSVRPTVGACVSTPLRWQEVTKKLDPRKFTIETVPARIDKLGDLWEPVLGKGVDLARCLAEITS